jgi:hypothetical protein
MKSIKFIFIATILSCCYQSNAQEVVTSGGDYFSNSSGSLSFTMGEPIVETFLGTTKILTQGFQQTRLLIVNVEDFQFSKINAEVFPNPTNYLLNVRVKNAGNAKIRCKLYDSDGKFLFRNDSSEQEFTISMSQFGSGIYYLKVATRHNEMETFKIIKN